MGADALLIEVHPNPAEAWSDGAQQLSLDGFAKLMQELKPFIAAAGREQAGRCDVGLKSSSSSTTTKHTNHTK
jgi:hypothetical protein